MSAYDGTTAATRPTRYTDVADPDASDIQASLDGSEAAFARLVQRHQDRVAKIMWRFTRNRDVLEELVQDVFVEVYFSLRSYRGDAPLSHWLARVATRVGYRFWKDRAKKRDRAGVRNLDAVAGPEQTDPPHAGEVLDALLSRLKAAERLVLTLQYLEQCSVKEIARRTGWTAAMVKMRSYRARKKLRRIAQRQKLLEKLEWTH